MCVSQRPCAGQDLVLLRLYRQKWINWQPGEICRLLTRQFHHDFMRIRQFRPKLAFCPWTLWVCPHSEFDRRNPPFLASKYPKLSLLEHVQIQPLFSRHSNQKSYWRRYWWRWPRTTFLTENSNKKIREYVYFDNTSSLTVYLGQGTFNTLRAVGVGFSLTTTQ